MLNNVSWISSPKKYEESYYFRKVLDIATTHKDIFIERKGNILYINVPREATLKLNGKTTLLQKGAHSFNIA